LAEAQGRRKRRAKTLSGVSGLTNRPALELDKKILADQDRDTNDEAEAASMQFRFALL
jgi:hypothetical protein